LEVVVVLVEEPDQVVDLVAEGVGGPEAGSSSKGCQLCKGRSCYITVDFAMATSQFTNWSLNNSTNDLVSQLFYDKR
jgi:hypothetical protein